MMMMMTTTMRMKVRYSNEPLSDFMALKYQLYHKISDFSVGVQAIFK